MTTRSSTLFPNSENLPWPQIGRIAWLILICLSNSLHSNAEKVAISGRKIALPEGNVLGADFYEGRGIFFVQQDVLSPGDGGLSILAHRRLSSWNSRDGSMISERVFDEKLREVAFPCGRLAISPGLNRIFLCSAGSHLEIIDPDNLKTVGTFAHTANQNIHDFAIDDVHGQVLVLTQEAILFALQVIPWNGK